MDLTNVSDLVGHKDPVEMPVSELLTGCFSFSIPSYQRGYRWESSESGDDTDGVKQVDDLINDLTAFVKSNREANYYLQPLMLKPRLAVGGYVWDVLDGQQRLTTMLLILKCLNERLYPASPLKLYRLEYANRRQLDFGRVTFDPASADHAYPPPSANLDSYYVSKAKARIERWYDTELSADQSLQDKFKEMLFYPDASRPASTAHPSLRAKFIWYNVEPLSAGAAAGGGDRKHDIEVFNRLNRGKISLTDSELIKALFLLCIKVAPASGSSLMTPATLVRKWDEMGKKLQNDSFWTMIAPKGREYGNRMDLLFDFIKDCEGATDNCGAYRFYYGKMRHLLTDPDLPTVEALWAGVKRYFDTLCKWHENVTKHNYIGFLVDSGMSLSAIFHDGDLEKHVRNCLGLADVDDIDGLTYQDRDDFIKIRKTLLLFNVLTCDKFGLKFPYDLYRDNSYDVEHVNSQTDNPIEKTEEKIGWIMEHALPCLWMDRGERDGAGHLTAAATEAYGLIARGIGLLRDFARNGNRDIGNRFKPYRAEVENYYASGHSSTAMANKDAIGNLTLLNSSINREYQNALFPKKLRVLKRSDQEGVYIPLCTKYMFLKYYSNPGCNASAFSMMRWRQEDQRDYTQAIKDTLRKIL